MKVHIINISDFPANISREELQRGLSFLEKNGYEICRYNINIRNNNIEEFNKIMSDEAESIVLFSSGGFDAINNISDTVNTIGRGKKFLLGFSDTLHIQSKYYNVENVFNIYGVTLRNIFLLTKKQSKVLYNFVCNQKLQIDLQEENIYTPEPKGKLYGGHIMVFFTTLGIYDITLDRDILYLEFHGMPEYLVYYYLDILKARGLFRKVSSIIIDKNPGDNIDKKRLMDYLYRLEKMNIYMTKNASFFPFYKTVNIKKGKLTLLH